jgi:UDP-2,3-diacylglucosamine pyrophosphatase LpxH
MTVLRNFNHNERHEFLSIKHGKIIVLHGDQYDAVTSNVKWLSKFGGMLYDVLIYINRPLSKYLKNLTKKIVSGASGFQGLVKKECQEGEYEGLICGHNHRPEILRFNTHFYLNTGDWVESCSAIVEENDGTIKLLKIEEDFKINTISEL